MVDGPFGSAAGDGERFTYQMLQREQNQQREFEQHLRTDTAGHFDLEPLFKRCGFDPKKVWEELEKLPLTERSETRGWIRAVLDCLNRLAIGVNVGLLNYGMVERAHGSNICMSLLRFYRSIQEMRGSTGTERVFDDLIVLTMKVARDRKSLAEHRSSKWMYGMVEQLAGEMLGKADSASA